MAGLTSAKTWARRHIWALVMLAALLILSNLFVRYYKRPGQMSVIQAQSMDMAAMKPPIGAIPVATEFVTRRLFTPRVRYTGTIVAYTEQNIYPRVQGLLTGLRVYNGDRVRAGQVLAVLDSPDLQSKLEEAAYGHVAAARGISVARANLARMQAEQSAAKGEVEAARREVERAQARLTAAQRGVTQAEKALASAEASLAYWKAEITRERNLLKEGAVSQQEFDSELAQYVAAEAEVESRQAMLEESRANADAARAELGATEARSRIARDRARAADAALSAAVGEASREAAMADMAGAARTTAATFDRYRVIRAPFAGVVTQRLLSPGVLVNPGTPIMNVAQIDRVRLQVNVADKDLASITLGAGVSAYVLKGTQRKISARVSSISPSADPATRTSTVEAVVDNLDHSLLPGQFVSMDIAAGATKSAITVPSAALIRKNNRDAVWITRCTTRVGKTEYYCTMHPEVMQDRPGTCPKCNGMALVPRQSQTGKTAHAVYVTVGRTDGERTEILSGLAEGNEVIYAGMRYLKEGDAVTPTKWGEEGPLELPAPPGGTTVPPDGSDRKDRPGQLPHGDHSGHGM